MPTTNLLHCPTHHRSWQGDGSDAVQSCPWCEIERLRKLCEPPLVRDTFCIDMDNPIAEGLVLEWIEPKVLAGTVRRENKMRLTWQAKCIVLEEKLLNAEKGVDQQAGRAAEAEAAVHELEEQVTALESERNRLRRLCEPVAQTDQETEFYRKHDQGK